MVQIVTDMTSNSEQKNTTTIMSPKQKFDFNYVHPGATSLSVASRGVENASLTLISSPNLTGNFRPQISSAMPAIAGLLFWFFGTSTYVLHPSTWENYRIRYIT